jgi:hypothetical protein
VFRLFSDDTESKIETDILAIFQKELPHMRRNDNEAMR